MPALLECVVNLSEGRRDAVIARIAAAARTSLLDVHSDPHHHRSVLTLAGPEVEEAVRAVSARAVAEIDVTGHNGVHPRMGAVDVVPFVPIGGIAGPASRAGSVVEPASRAGSVVEPASRAGSGDLSTAVEARDRFVAWAARELELPCFVYGPERGLPEVRRLAFGALEPAAGPASPHPTAGATAVGARTPLVAYNLWLAEPDLALARALAADLRSPAVRALGLEVGGRAQVSCNLIDPVDVGPAAVYDAVARRVGVARAELVGLVPGVVLGGVPAHRWSELDLDRERTIEARLEAAGIR